MGQIIPIFNYFSGSTRSSVPSPQLPFSRDCSPFLNWGNKRKESLRKKVIVFRSLVATVKLQPALDVSLEAKAVEFLQSVYWHSSDSPTVFLNSFGQTTDESSTDFVHNIVVLTSLPSHAITTAAIELLYDLLTLCTTKCLLALVKADLISQLITSLNPQSLSFAETCDIHITLMDIIPTSFRLTTPNGLTLLTIKDRDEQEADCETVLKRVLVPSEKYICHLCVNRYSIVDGELSYTLLKLLTLLLDLCPYYQPTMDFVLHLPVCLTIPSCLTFFENESPIWVFLDFMHYFQQRWNITWGEGRQMWKAILRMLRMEGLDDVTEENQQNDQDEEGESIVVESIEWNNQLGMNVPQLW
ncbi:hypothetical protein BLNAU_20105 [Blattamonas nauphoetae]|uniref:Uncharacterized protein n=1 Tax=Blattamonas nauphoetae TaxID=2049346 RepID=A0ABQ9WZP5_9EUKA|nr:hypothetical protein BLNAU_20105 [Blattamonas nauphoetae]